MYFQREYPKRLKAGMVGIGKHSYRTLFATLHHLPVQLEAIAAHSDVERARLTAAEFGCRCYMSAAEMYAKEKLDVVFVCVGPEEHPDLVCEALDAGLHVWLEKPPAMRVSGIEKMIAHRRDRVVVVGFKKAFMPVVDKALEIVASPQFGKLHTILGVYPMTIPANGQKVLDGGEFINWLANGVHPVAFLMAIGGKVESIVAHTNASGHGAFIMNFASGVIGNFHMGSGPHPMEAYSLYGEGWHCDITNNTRLALYRAYGPTNTHTFMPAGFDTGAIVWEAQNCLATIENANLFTQGIYAETKYFCDCVIEGRRAERGGLEFALELMKVYEAGLLSEGRRIKIE